MKGIIKGKITIHISGRDLPCYVTMGALVRFKEETGQDVANVQDMGMEGSLVLLWCCVKSACVREGIPFDMDMQTFFDNLTEEDIAGAFQPEATEEQKKT